MKTTKPRTDRIDRALALVTAGMVVALHAGAYLARGSRARKTYTITAGHCPCPDAARGHVCKHLWASAGAPAAVAIDNFRRAVTLESLRALGAAFADVAVTLDARFVRVARSEYVAARNRLALVESEVAA